MKSSPSRPWRQLLQVAPTRRCAWVLSIQAVLFQGLVRQPIVYLVSRVINVCAIGCFVAAAGCTRCGRAQPETAITSAAFASRDLRACVWINWRRISTFAFCAQQELVYFPEQILGVYFHPKRGLRIADLNAKILKSSYHGSSLRKSR